MPLEVASAHTLDAVCLAFVCVRLCLSVSVFVYVRLRSSTCVCVRLRASVYVC